MAIGPVKYFNILKIKPGHRSKVADVVSTEEPLSIRILYGKTGSEMFELALTMRTPGTDKALACGFLWTESVISSLDDIIEIDYDKEECRKHGSRNVLNVVLSPDFLFDPELFKRNFYSHSGCGVCGKASIESLTVKSTFRIDQNEFKVNESIFYGMYEKLVSQQVQFEDTGGIHACALFNEEGLLIDSKEDVGRHNAMDKLIGSSFLSLHLPLSKNIVLVSGRASFELVQKAIMAGIPIMASIGAPSSLAVELANEKGMTLVGFLKPASLNVYSPPDRIISNT